MAEPTVIAPVEAAASKRRGLKLSGNSNLRQYGMMGALLALLGRALGLIAPALRMPGVSRMVSAADAATSARMSDSFSLSHDSTVMMTWVSFLNPSTNSGRIGRSIRRLISVSRSVGRPSRLK